MSETLPSYQQALCYTAQDDRKVFADLVCVGGVSNLAASGLLVSTNGSFRDLSVAQGGAFIEGTIDSNQGIYHVYNDGPEIISINANTSGLPRIDQVIARVYDSTYEGTDDKWEIEPLAGTATSGANLTNKLGAAALPNNSIRLAYVLMPNGFTGPFSNFTHILDARTAYQMCAIPDEDTYTVTKTVNQVIPGSGP